MFGGGGDFFAYSNQLLPVNAVDSDIDNPPQVIR